MSEQDYHTTKFFTANVLAIEMKKNKKTKILMKKTCLFRTFNIRIK